MHMTAFQDRGQRLAQRDALLRMHDALSYQMHALLQGPVGVISVHEWMKTLDKELTAYITKIEAELDALQTTEVAELADQINDQSDSIWIKSVALLHAAYSCL